MGKKIRNKFNPKNPKNRTNLKYVRKYENDEIKKIIKESDDIYELMKYLNPNIDSEPWTCFYYLNIHPEIHEIYLDPTLKEKPLISDVPKIITELYNNSPYIDSSVYPVLVQIFEKERVLLKFMWYSDCVIQLLEILSLKTEFWTTFENWIKETCDDNKELRDILGEVQNINPNLSELKELLDKSTG